MMHPWALCRLSAYLDGELTPQAALAVERHVARCRSCGARLAGLRHAQNALRSALRSAPPDGAWLELLERMDAPGDDIPMASPPGRRLDLPSGPRRRRLAWGLGTAAALAAFAMALYLTSPKAPEPRRSTASFVTTADLVGDDDVTLSPSLELLLVAQQDGGPGPRGDR